MIASKAKHVRRGVKEVGKALRKGEKGLVVVAGDISPLDVISHIPVLCEDHSVPYIFVPSKEKLGEASSTKRPTSVTMIVLGGKNKDTKAAADYKELYDECYAEAKTLVNSAIYFCYLFRLTLFFYFNRTKILYINKVLIVIFFSLYVRSIIFSLSM